MHGGEGERKENKRERHGGESVEEREERSEAISRREEEERKRVPSLQSLAAREEGEHAPLEPAVVGRDGEAAPLAEIRGAGTELDISNSAGNCREHGWRGPARKICRGTTGLNTGRGERNPLSWRSQTPRDLMRGIQHRRGPREKEEEE